MRRLSKTVDEKIAQITLQMQPALSRLQSPSSSSDITRIEKKLIDIEEQINDKASKSSVAQALHRKVNKTEFDEEIKQKVNINELGRIIQVLDQKVDQSNFDKIIQTINNKADKFEL